MEPFSLRHRKALTTKRIRVSMRKPLRVRLWKTLQAYDESYRYQPRSDDRWNEDTSLLAQVAYRLTRLMGGSDLRIKGEHGAEETKLAEYFEKGYPSNALDVIEQFDAQLRQFHGRAVHRVIEFQSEVNDAMVSFDCPWRLVDGRFFQVDLGFFESEVIQRADGMLQQHGFEGAHDEFREAREDLSDGRAKDAILKAFKSFESSLKTVLNLHNGDVTRLLAQFREEGYMDDIPEPHAKAIQKQVLASVATLRNELAGHGQGNEVIEIPNIYAALAVRLSACLNQFVIDQYLRKSPKCPDEQEPSTSESAEDHISDDDLPF